MIYGVGYNGNYKSEYIHALRTRYAPESNWIDR